MLFTYAVIQLQKITWHILYLILMLLILLLGSQYSDPLQYLFYRMNFGFYLNSPLKINSCNRLSFLVQVLICQDKKEYQYFLTEVNTVQI